MKKILIMLMVFVMLLALVACGDDEATKTNKVPQNAKPTATQPNGTEKSATQPTQLPTAPVAEPTTQPHVHDYTAVITKPTCTAAGYTTYACVCGDTYQGDSVAAVGHDWMDATCTEAKTCFVCGEIEGSAKGHQWETATCTKPKTCTACGKTEGSTKSHEYVDGECVDCGNKDPELELQEFETNAIITEKVLFDEYDIRIIAIEIKYTWYDVDIKLLFENNSNMDLSFVSGSTSYCCNSINGFMMYGGYVNCEVNAGKKAFSTIDFDYSELRMHGIYAVADVEIAFRISDGEDFRVDTGPLSIETSIKNEYVYDEESYQKAIVNKALQHHVGYSVDYFVVDTLFEGKSVSIVSACVTDNGANGKYLMLEVVNNSNAQIKFVSTDIAINGLMVSTGIWDYDTINPGKRCVISITLTYALDEDFWELLNIDEITSVELGVKIQDMDYKDLTTETRVKASKPNTEDSLNADGTEVYTDDNVQIVSKGLVTDSGEYSDDIYLLLLVKNNSDKNLQLDDVYDSLSVNGFMADGYICYSIEILPNEYGLVVIELMDYGFENIGIEKMEDISEIEIVLNVSEGYNTIVKAKICIAL